MSRPTVLVMARAPRPGRCKTRLEPLLGPEGCAALQRGLILHTLAFARAVGDVVLAYDPPDAREEMAALVGEATNLLVQAGDGLGERLAHASGAVLAERSGPLLVVGTDMPRLGAFHARGALEDLAAGCDAAVGPALDGGYYLIAFARALPELFALPTPAWGGPEVLARTLALAREAGLAVGMLRAERDLDTPADARAALADPLYPAEIAALLHPPSA